MILSQFRCPIDGLPMMTERTAPMGPNPNEDVSAGSPRLYDTSALFMMVCPDSTSTGLPDTELDIQAVT